MAQEYTGLGGKGAVSVPLSVLRQGDTGRNLCGMQKEDCGYFRSFLYEMWKTHP